MDPANDRLPYECAVNVEELVRLEDVMGQHGLGPNGGLVYCMDYIDKNFDWLQSKLKPLEKDHYFLFDFPGQVELFTLHASAQSIIKRLTDKMHYRRLTDKKHDIVSSFVQRAAQVRGSAAAAVTPVPSCPEPHKYVSALLLSLQAMLHFELPHVNVLSKIDLVEAYGPLAFNLDFYTDVQDLSYLQQHLESDPRNKRYAKLTSAVCEVVDDFGLVSFETLNIQDKESVSNLIRTIDRANGYVFAGIEASAAEYSKIATRSMQWEEERYPPHNLSLLPLTISLTLTPHNLSHSLSPHTHFYVSLFTHPSLAHATRLDDSTSMSSGRSDPVDHFRAQQEQPLDEKEEAVRLLTRLERSLDAAADVAAVETAVASLLAPDVRAGASAVAADRASSALDGTGDEAFSTAVRDAAVTEAKAPILSPLRVLLSDHLVALSQLLLFRPSNASASPFRPPRPARPALPLRAPPLRARRPPPPPFRLPLRLHCFRGRGVAWGGRWGERDGGKCWGGE
ncbi:unnamed protein product [Closterium sp. Yama58-4]|nr:unnamed protein product [Closterium sp. Yama58-4]